MNGKALALFGTGWLAWISTLAPHLESGLRIVGLVLGCVATGFAIAAWRLSIEKSREEEKAAKLNQCRFLLEGFCISGNKAPRECPFPSGKRPEHCVLKKP